MKRIALNGKHGKGKFALVDDDDYSNLNSFRWVLDIHGYAIRSAHKDDGNATTMSMHRQVMHATRGTIIDHKDGNTLDNRKQNLRIASQAQNLWNRGAQKNSKSGIKGVCKIKGQRNNKWIAQIGVSGKRYHLGYYRTQAEACTAYRMAAVEYHGEFARLNSI